jgi:hypothetical protein
MNNGVRTHYAKNFTKNDPPKTVPTANRDTVGDIILDKLSYIIDPNQ